MKHLLSHPNKLPALARGFLFSSFAFAGTAKKWNDVPEAVRQTILANGGSVGSADLEGHKVGGKAVHEAVGKDKSGKSVDLVIIEDGKLITTKDDDAADRAKDIAAAAGKQAKKILADVKFSHPRDITNPHLPLASLKQHILEGREGGKKARIVRTIMPDAIKTFKIGKQTVESLVMQDTEYVAGELEEVTLDYFAQDDNGTVYYLGEDVDEYKDGKIVGHSGAWLFGKDTQVPGVILPGKPKVGDKFKPEAVSAEITETDEVLSLSETVTVPAGNYKNCLKLKKLLADGKVEFKYHAPGVGVVKEVIDEDVNLISHTTR